MPSSPLRFDDLCRYPRPPPFQTPACNRLGDAEHALAVDIQIGLNEYSMTCSSFAVRDPRAASDQCKRRRALVRRRSIIWRSLLAWLFPFARRRRHATAPLKRARPGLTHKTPANAGVLSRLSWPPDAKGNSHRLGSNRGLICLIKSYEGPVSPEASVKRRRGSKEDQRSAGLVGPASASRHVKCRRLCCCQGLRRYQADAQFFKMLPSRLTEFMARKRSNFRASSAGTANFQPRG